MNGPDPDRPVLHSSLRPGTNLGLLFVWGLTAVPAALLSPPVGLVLGGLGLVTGLVGGYLQFRALRANPQGLLAARSALEVRRALTASASGWWYVAFFWISSLAAAVTAFFLLLERVPFGFLLWYATFAFVREAVTLPASFSLARLARAPVSADPGRSDRLQV